MFVFQSSQGRIFHSHLVSNLGDEKKADEIYARLDKSLKSIGLSMEIFEAALNFASEKMMEHSNETGLKIFKSPPQPIVFRNPVSPAQQVQYDAYCSEIATSDFITNMAKRANKMEQKRLWSKEDSGVFLRNMVTVLARIKLHVYENADQSPVLKGNSQYQATLENCDTRHTVWFGTVVEGAIDNAIQNKTSGVEPISPSMGAILSNATSVSLLSDKEYAGAIAKIDSTLLANAQTLSTLTYKTFSEQQLNSQQYADFFKNVPSVNIVLTQLKQDFDNKINADVRKKSKKAGKKNSGEDDASGGNFA